MWWEWSEQTPSTHTRSEVCHSRWSRLNVVATCLEYGDCLKCVSPSAGVLFSLCLLRFWLQSGRTLRSCLLHFYSTHSVIVKSLCILILYLPSIRKRVLIKDEELPWLHLVLSATAWEKQPKQKQEWTRNLKFDIISPEHSSHVKLLLLRSYQFQGYFLLSMHTDEDVFNFVLRTLSCLYLDTLQGGLTLPLFIITSDLVVLHWRTTVNNHILQWPG